MSRVNDQLNPTLGRFEWKNNNNKFSVIPQVKSRKGRVYSDLIFER